MTLSEHLKNENIKTQEWVNAEKGRWATSYVTDIAHWNDMGVHTVADFELYNARATFADMYKSVHGHRAHHLDIYNMEMDELAFRQAELDEDFKLQVEAEIEIEAQGAKEFELEIANNIKLGASDRASAICWIIDGEGDHQFDAGYFCYSRNLNSSYAKEIKALEGVR